MITTQTLSSRREGGHFAAVKSAPTLTGPCVTLRAPIESDVSDRLALGNDREILSLAMIDEYPRADHEPERWLQNRRKPSYWMIEHGGLWIGFLSIWAYGGNTHRMGVAILDRSKLGQGLGTEAMQLALRYAFDEIRVKSVTLGVFPDNERAIRAYRKCGFVETHRQVRAIWMELDRAGFEKSCAGQAAGMHIDVHSGNPK